MAVKRTRARAPESVERDARIWQMHKAGLSNNVIARQEHVTTQFIGQQLTRIIAEMFYFEIPQQQMVEKARLEDMIARLNSELRTPAFCYAAGKGTLVLGPDGNPLVDRMHTLAVLRELRATYESMRKLLGTDAVTITRKIVEIVEAETVEAEIARLELELELGQKPEGVKTDA